MDGEPAKIKLTGTTRQRLAILAVVLVLGIGASAWAQEGGAGVYVPDPRGLLPEAKDAPGTVSAVQILILLTVLALAPALLIMVTCFTRIIVVLALLRQALATQQLPPNQVLIGLALFMTFMVMAPTWYRVQSEALTPYLDNRIDQTEAFNKGISPVREFMIRQIEACDNERDVHMFLAHSSVENVQRWRDVPTSVLVPAFITSELKTAFVIGFRIYLPFLVIDMVIASVLISMGMLMLPPMLISLPFKLLLFVLVDGWHLIVGNLIDGFA